MYTIPVAHCDEVNLGISDQSRMITLVESIAEGKMSKKTKIRDC